MRQSATAALAALLTWGIVVPVAAADPVKCRLGVLKASAEYARVTLAARQRCEDAIVKAKSAVCPDAAATAAFAKAASKLDQLVAKACGGKNKVCDAADTGLDADDTPAALGFPDECPDFAGASCGQPLVGCADFGPCLRCLADGAVTDDADLAWDGFVVPSGDKRVVKCQRAIGRSGGALFTATSKALQKCWAAVAKGKVAGPCPVPGDTKAPAAIAKATAKHSDAVCKACGGLGDRAPADGRCDGGTPLDLALVGRPATCGPEGASCGGNLIPDLDALVGCQRCATTFAATCADRAAAQGLVDFPPSCTGTPIVFVDDEVDGQDGVDGLDFPTGSAVSPDGKHVYVAGEFDDSIAIFARDAATGALAFVGRVVEGEGGVSGLGFVFTVTMSPDGKHLYSVSIDGAVAAFARNPTSGGLTFVEAEVDGQNGVDGLAFGRDVVVSPDGAHVYAAGLGDDAVAIFSRDGTTGTLGFLGLVQDDVDGVDGIDGAATLAFAPGGTQLYVGGNIERAIAVFTRNPTTGALGFVEAEKDGVNGVDGLFGLNDLAVSPDGAHLYAAAGAVSSLTRFGRDAATGAITFQQRLTDGQGGISSLGGAGGVAVSPDGGRVFVTAEQDSTVTVFGRDPATGALDLRDALFDGVDVPFLDSASGPVLSPDGAHLYVVAGDDDAINAFAVQ
jgi:6-phosphogluconolactonase (cycloisomerase 2 family)